MIWKPDSRKEQPVSWWFLTMLDEMDWRGAKRTADFQGINNPGYNRDHGPVAVGSVRFHFEF